MKIIVMGVIGDVIKPGRRKTRVPTAIRLWAADMATSCVWTARHFEVKKKRSKCTCTHRRGEGDVVNLVVDLMVKYRSRINSLASGINKWKDKANARLINMFR